MHVWSACTVLYKPVMFWLQATLQLRARASQPPIYHLLLRYMRTASTSEPKSVVSMVRAKACTPNLMLHSWHTPQWLEAWCLWNP